MKKYIIFIGMIFLVFSTTLIMAANSEKYKHFVEEKSKKHYTNPTVETLNSTEYPQIVIIRTNVRDINNKTYNVNVIAAKNRIDEIINPL